MPAKPVCEICKNKTLAKKTIEVLIDKLYCLKRENKNSRAYEYIYYDLYGKPIWRKYKGGYREKYSSYEYFYNQKEWKYTKRIGDCIYNIHNLRLAAIDKQPLFIANNEEEANALKAMGFYSITFSNGLDNYNFIKNLQELLFEMTIYIIQPHCDNGLEIAEGLANFISSPKNTIKILDIDKIYPMLKGDSYIDIIYYLCEEDGCVIDNILKLIDDTRVYIKEIRY